MKTALVIGHFDPFLPEPLGFTDIPAHIPDPDYRKPLELFGSGFREAVSGWKVDLIPFGSGSIFAGELESMGAVTLPTSGQNDPFRLPTTDPVLIEMGHDMGHDWGARLWSTADAEELRGRDIVVAYSTSRPLYGAGATSNTDPLLRLRDDVSEPVGWRRTLKELAAGERPRMTLGNQASADTYPWMRPGSGAGGGAAAWLMALGARAYPTGQVLAQYLQLEQKISQADLVIIATPHWHSPDLADAVPMHAVELSSLAAVPTVGVGFGSSLSAHEQAQWGVHGVHLVGRHLDFKSLGRRIGQTWGTR